MKNLWHLTTSQFTQFPLQLFHTLTTKSLLKTSISDFFKTLLTLYYTISLQHIKLVASNFLCNLSISAVSKNFVYTCNKKPQTNKGKICENCWKTIDAIEKKICLTTWLTFTPQTNNNYKNKISSSIKWNLSKWQRALQREVKKLHRFSKKKNLMPQIVKRWQIL